MSKKHTVEKEPILYERYKRMHPDAAHQLELPIQKRKKRINRGMYGIVVNFMLTGILICLIFLAAIGVITLLNEDMRLMLDNIFKQYI